jgi:hypothetical protein
MLRQPSSPIIARSANGRADSKQSTTNKKSPIKGLINVNPTVPFCQEIRIPTDSTLEITISIVPAAIESPPQQSLSDDGPMALMGHWQV